jgi:nucleotide-binding universal stress UspA family protein
MVRPLNILVCTDFSSFSFYAAKAAEKIREKCNGTAHLVHICEFSVMWDWMPPDYIEGRFELDLLNTLREKMDQEIEKTGLKAQGHVEIGIIPTLITQQALEKKINLIVIGHKGQSARFHLGSIAQKIIQTATVPVLVVKNDFVINKIAGLIDPNGEMEEIINWTEDLSLLFKCEPQIISLFPDVASRFIGVGRLGVSTELLSLTDHQKELIKKDLKDKIKSKLILKETDLRIEFSTERKVSYHLNEIVEEEKIDLVIMKKHQSEFLEKILIGSETRRMLEILNKNLLILPV